MARGDGKNMAAKAVIRKDTHVQPFEPKTILTILERHKVDFVVIGAYAAVLQGSKDATEDVDITPKRDFDNLTRLVEALHEMHAQVIDEDGEPDLNWPIDDQHLRLLKATFFSTLYGDIDVSMNPSASEGYPDLSRSSESFWVSIGEVKIKVANLERVIESKRKADRPKDREIIPKLEKLLNKEESKQ